jgi:hypothetical protein
LLNCSPNSVKFIDKITAWFPATANIATAIIATMINLANFPVSGGGACLSVEALYKINVSCGSVN